MTGKTKKSGGPNEADTDSRLPKSVDQTGQLGERWQVVGVCLFLAAIIWMVFGRTVHHDFINLDDPAYVTTNSGVTNGVTYQGIIWALTWVHAGNWHPITWISHMLDCQIYGLNPGGHHLTNVLIHAATAILLFLNLRGMTGKLWRSAFVAAVFAIHPLRVESVAWVSERKDVLSGLFFMLTIGAYVWYARRRWSAGRYGLVLLMFAMGLMSKPMLVTVPLVLLLLDYWPLNRFRHDPAAGPDFRLAGRLILEKVPLLGMSAAVCAITIIAQHGAIQYVEGSSSLSLRLGNVLNSYVVYLGQMFWPEHLVVLYPFPSHGLNIAGVILSALLLAGITAGAFILQRRPYLLTGWLWYLVMLVPVIGIVQVGLQAHADRYTYLPQIGLYLLLTWAMADICANVRSRRLLLGGGATVIVTALIFCAHKQASYWRNSESLWTHALAYTKDNYVAEDSLGCVLLEKGDVDGAIAYCQKALEVRPDYVNAHNNLGNALLRKGRVDEAISQFQKAQQIMPGNADAYNNLGNALLRKGQVDEAIIQFKKALAVEPDNKVVRDNLENALLEKGGVDKVVIRYRKALQTAPDNVSVLNNLAWLLATCPDGRIRDGAQAVAYAERACQLTHYRVAPLIGTLAAAYAEVGRYDEAIAMEEKACELAVADGDEDLLSKSKELLALYKTHHSFHGVAEKFIPVTP